MMKVHFYNVRKDSIDTFALFEYESGRLTSRRFKDIVSTLFQYSCENGVDAENLAAIVSVDSHIIFSVSCCSYSRALEPSAIDARVMIHPQAGPARETYRIMNIAE